jgi:hypothetical protein
MKRDTLAYINLLVRLVYLTDKNKVRWEEVSIFQLHTAKLELKGGKFTIRLLCPQDENSSISLNGVPIRDSRGLLMGLRNSIISYYERNDLYGHGRAALLHNQEMQKLERADRNRDLKNFMKTAQRMLAALESE